MRYPLGHPTCKAIDLGSGRNPRKDFNFITIDKSEKCKPDIIRDIERGLPFDDNSIDVIYTSHFLEHIKDLIFVMNEVWRVLKPDGEFEIIVPCGENTWVDPTHLRKFTIRQFDYFTDKLNERSPHYKEDLGIKCSFEIVKIKKIDDGKAILAVLSKPSKEKDVDILDHNLIQ